MPVTFEHEVIAAIFTFLSVWSDSNLANASKSTFPNLFCGITTTSAIVSIHDVWLNDVPCE